MAAMSAWLWLAVWILGVFASIAIHEAGHAITALLAGWEYKGLTFKWYVLGIGVKLEPTKDEHGRQLALIASMGLVGSLVAAVLFFGLAQIPNSDAHAIFFSLSMLNVAIAILNVFPTPITDGGHILTGLFGWTIKWRYALAGWIALELVWLWILFLR